MAFRLPSSLAIKQQYSVVSPSNVVALEASLPSNSRMLVSLVFAERYDGFEEDCEVANSILQEQSGLLPWEEYQRFVTADPDGEPVAWVSYQSSPVWWTWILIVLGGVFFLPILSVGGTWISELIFPGIGSIISIAMLVGMGFLVYYLVKELTPVAKEVAPELIAAKLAG